VCGGGGGAIDTVLAPHRCLDLLRGGAQVQMRLQRPAVGPALLGGDERLQLAVNRPSQLLSLLNGVTNSANFSSAAANSFSTAIACTSMRCGPSGLGPAMRSRHSRVKPTPPELVAYTSRQRIRTPSRFPFDFHPTQHAGITLKRRCPNSPHPNQVQAIRSCALGACGAK